MTIHLKNIKYDVVVKALDGEVECGDHYLVKELASSTLFAVADGLGHGEEAARAATEAMHLIDHYAGESLSDLFKICHHHLKKTRGVALTLTQLDDDNNLTYLSIGNVMGVCWHANKDEKSYVETFFMYNGIVGDRIPLLQTRNIKMQHGDTLILATDGIKNDFVAETVRKHSTFSIANTIFDKYRNIKDDALVLVLRLLEKNS